VGGIENTVLRARTLTPGIVIVAVLALAGVLLRRRRHALWAQTQLMFTDELPSDVQRLELRT
jgi:uncharacterized protein (TIGR03382 family)